MGIPLDPPPLPIFPLTGTLLLPGTFLPLNVFEERYRNLVQDALEADGWIGMIQPMIPGLDNFGVPPLDLDDPELYPVGCSGRLHQHELQDDGRYLIVLEGIVRFRILEELDKKRGYRRIRADFVEFEIDLRSSEVEIEKREVLSVLDGFARDRDLDFDLDLLDSLDGPRLVSTLSTALPFSPAEKQALLEARTPQDRATLLITLMGIDSAASSLEYAPPTIH